MASLDEYRNKRDFRRTPEPSGDWHPTQKEEEGGEPKGQRFVVHKHAARRLHYDLRLESEGVLESWALPRGPSLEPGERRLAVRTEDHPLEYGDFEGVIPEGEYGAGTVMLWDRGRWHEKRRGPDRIELELSGRRLRGAWTLVRMVGRSTERRESWLMIRRRERRPGPRPEIDAPEGPEAGAEATVGGDADRSVATGRTMEEIAADRDRTWTSGGAGTGGSADKPAALPEPPDPKAIPGARPGPLPADPRPQLATPAERAPGDRDWLHEIKLDGYRILARVQEGQVWLFSRNGEDWTDRFPEIAALLADLPGRSALLDGEAVALGTDGASSFRRLQEGLSTGRTADLSYQVFDLLHLDGQDLTGAALVDRKRALARLLESAGYGVRSRVRFCDHILGKGPGLYSQACRLGLEGIVSKRADAPYRSGRSRDWLKVKCVRHEELLVGGYTAPSGARSGFGALLLGGYKDGRLIYAGRVGTGFGERTLKDLHGLLRGLEVSESPFDPAPAERGLRWVRPELVADVELAEWTRDGKVRQASFRGLREDLNPREIRLPDAALAADPSPQPQTGTRAHARTAARGASSVRPQLGSRSGEAQGRRGGGDASVAGVRITNPERVLFPGEGITKLALAHYYEEVGERILPQVAGRPLSLMRCPEGRGSECFFQKHPTESFAKGLPRVDVVEKGGRTAYLYVQDLPDLISLVQAGSLELHPWGSRVGDLERPDLLVFDLDPAPDLPWSEVLRAARGLKERLHSLALPSFVRTTGGKGLHVAVPLAPGLGWDEAKSFARALAQAQARDDPRRLTASLSKAKREGRVFIDYLRNGRGATAVASYSVRAREHAPVAVPVGWDELGPALSGDRWTLETLRRRLAALDRDPWEGFEEARRPLEPGMLAAVSAGRGVKP